MEAGHRAARKGRKLGSSRRRQTREPAAGQDGPVAPESWPSQAAEELQGFFQACGAAERGFVTREDLAVAKFSFLGSEEEPEMIFDWVDVERKGHLSLEEFSSGLKSIFGSSPSSQRVRGRRPLSSKRGSAATSFPVLEEADAEEKEAFLAFMEQLGGDHSLPEQEIWQLWGKLRQEEPQLAGNLEGFLAQMTSRLQEARADKEALELTLRKRDSDHQREVQQLYEEMEQQIGRQKQQLQAKSDSRDLALSSQMQEVLEAKEREVQQLAEGQRELEAELQRLSSAHREAGSEKLQLREAQRDLAGRLEQVQEQLQMTQGHLNFARSRVSWQVEKEPSVPRAGEDEAPDPQAVSSEEAPLPGLFEDNDDWDRLLNSFNSPWHRTPQLLWSPPATPTSPSAPQTPRVVRQISISEQHDLLFGREPSSDSNGAPRSPPGVTTRPEEGRAVDPGGQDLSATRPVERRGAHPQEGPGPGPETHFFGESFLPAAPAGESGGLVAAALEVLVPLGAGPPPQGTSPPAQSPAGPSTHFQTSDPDDRDSWAGPVPAKPPRQREALHQGPHTAGSAPRLEPRGARVLPAGLAELSEGLEGVAEAPLAEPPEGLEGVGQAEAPLAEPSEGLEGVAEAPLAEPPEGLEGVGQALLAEPPEGLEGVGQAEAPLAEPSEGLEGVAEAPLAEPPEGLEGVGQALLAEPPEGLEGVGQAEAPLAEPSEGLEGVAEAPLAEPPEGLEGVGQALLAEPPEGLEGVGQAEAPLAEPSEGLEGVAEAPLAEPPEGLEGVGQALLAEPPEGLEGVGQAEAPLAEPSEGLEGVAEAPLAEPPEGLEGVGQALLAEPPEGLEGVGQAEAPLAEPSEGLEGVAEAPLAEPPEGLEGVGQALLAEPPEGLEGVGQAEAPLAEPSEGLEGVAEAPLAEPPEGLEGVGQALLAEPPEGLEGVGQAEAPLAEPSEGLEGVAEAPLAEPPEGLEGVGQALLAEPPEGLEGVGQAEAPLAEPSEGLEGVAEAPLAEPPEGLEGVGQALLAEPPEGLEGVGQAEAPLAEPSEGLEGVAEAPLAEPPEGLEGVGQALLAEPPEGLEGVGQAEAPLAEPSEGLEGVAEAPLAEPPEGLEGVGQAPLAEPSEGLEGVAEAPLAEPPEGLECVAQAPTKAVAQQGELGPDVLEGRPGGLREAPGQVQLSGLPALPQQSLEEEPREEEGKQGGQGRPGLSSELPSEARGLRTGPSERPQRSSLPAPLPPDTAQAQAEAEGPAPGRPSPPRDSPPRGAQPGGGAGPQPPTNTLPSMEAALEAQPTLPPTAAQAEGEQGPPPPREPRAENRPEDPGTGSGEAGLTPSPGGPTGSEPPADPDYIYHIIFLGDSNVGKTSFLHLLHQDTFASGLTATVGVDFRVKNLLVDNKYYALQLWDTAGQERYHSMTRQLLRKADGVVLMYDVTSQESFAHVRYWLDCLQDAGCVGVVVLLLGNKMDCDEERQVSTEAGQQLAQELGLSFGECSAALGHNILEPMMNLARSLKRQEDLLKGSLVEVAPERPPKKAGCCS
ncbi:PREDICTED: ras-related protein Rab-44 isoform X2 [Myotis brandtii]|uniref:ras-related protein Rab-44 isoform X2 n=1 Tax=Myotis brandtii TaxID=109478 RepID=UPI000703C9DF|nr:PREDICTED: ras-related protein Rab-44 isoform X2 [Myotis brandtii]